MRNQLRTRALILSAALGSMVSIIAPAVAQAQTAPIQSASNTQVPVERLLIAQGKSAIIDLPVEARDVVVANPEIADAVMRTSRRGFLLGVKNGETNVYFLDAQGRQILALEVRIARDTSELDSLIQRLAPEARIKAEGVGESIILSGEVPNAAVSDRVLRIAQNYAGGVDKIVNLMNVKTGDQVQLRVRIIEMQRSAIKQLGVNLNGNNILNQILPENWTSSFATANGFSTNGSFLGGTSLDANWDAGKGQSVDTSVQALERVGLARTLAEPVLTATSGEAAKFLAGGEFPVPTSQEGNTVSVSFKPFGVGLGFTPTVLSHDRISLKVSTEVSEISTAISYRQADTVIRDATGRITDTIRGLSIPGVTTRRADTTLELPSGRSMVMAGLIQQATRQSIEGVPGLKDLPILGNLFKSRDFQSNDTELVIIITPYIVNSTTMDQLQSPGDGYAAATDAASILMGRMNRTVRPSSSGLPRGQYRAPIGHILQ
jgi:pilus assembly protein CpaC